MTDLIAQIIAHLRGMWRFRWWALIGSWLMCVAGFYWVYTLPNMYESTTQVYVDTQTALKDAIRGIGNQSDVQEEVRKKLTEMRSIPQLKKVARDTDLDIRASTPREMEKLIELMRSTIEISCSRGSFYSITFRDHDPVMAQRVVQTMLSDFVGQSLRDNSKDQVDARRFLEEQIAEYQKRLLSAENALAAFKKENFGMMLGESGDYYQRLEAATGRLAELRRTYRLKQRTKRELEDQIVGEEPTFGLEQDGADSGVVSTLDVQIDEWQALLAQQRLRLTEKHPDVIATLTTIETLEQQRDEELQQRMTSNPDRPAFNPLDQNPVYQTMKIQLNNVRVELGELETAIGEQSRQVAQLTKLVDTVPEVEAKLSRLNRDYEVTKTYHDDLLDRLEAARLGDDANKQSDDIKFQVMDPPILPLEPTGPNRPLFLTAILLAGLLFGVAVSFLLNQLKPVYSTRQELRNRTGLPVLGTIGVVLMPHQKLITRVQTVFFLLGLIALIGMYGGAMALEDRFVEWFGSQNVGVSL